MRDGDFNFDWSREGEKEVVYLVDGILIGCKPTGKSVFSSFLFLLEGNACCNGICVQILHKITETKQITHYEMMR